jgi:hypothetical protein
MVGIGRPKAQEIDMKKKTIALAAALAVAAPAVSYAGGFLADTFVRPFSPKAADDLDRAHAQLGNPLDHAANVAAGVAADAIAPGSGTAVTTILETRDAARRR